MKILIDIGHPAHVHLFKHFAREMLDEGHNVLFTCREKDFIIDLLKTYAFNFKSFGKKYNSKMGKLFGLVEFDTKVLLAGLKFKPDMLISHGSMYAAHAAFLLGKPHISLEDTFNFEQVNLYVPFTRVILTSNYNHPLKSQKVIKYAGYHELAYLHHRRFTPNKEVLNDLGVNDQEKYVILRFVSWKATHDMGHKGIAFVNKLRAVDEFSRHAKVFISSESKLPGELLKYKIKIAPHRIHDAIRFATFLFGESATMTSEAAMLGVPAIYIDNTGRYYSSELESKHGLVFNYTESFPDQQLAIGKGIELLRNPDIKDEWEQKREKMLADKIDVTAFLIWFIKNYPESKPIMKEKPDYQYNFR